MHQAKRDGFLVGSPAGLHQPDSTRYFHALLILDAMKVYRDLGEDLLRRREKPLPPEDAYAYILDYEAYRGLRRHLPTFARAQGEFLPQMLEYKRLEPGPYYLYQEVERTANRVEALGPAPVPLRFLAFPDVPKGHWAARAVRDLRAAGLLKGYPSGRAANP